MPKRKAGGIVRKQSQIDKARSTVLYWVMGSSALLGVGIVVIYLMVQSIMYTQKVINEKKATVKTLDANISAAQALEGEISTLNTNEELRSVRTSDDAQAVQSILDALPADANDLALGSSLQKKFFKPVKGLSVSQISISPVGDSSVEYVSDSGDQFIDFSFSATGSPSAIKTLLERLERSIRAIDVESLSASSTDSTKLNITLSGRVPYLPPVKIEMSEKKVPPVFGESSSKNKTVDEG